MKSKSSPSPLSEISPDAAGPRRMLRAVDRDGGVYYFAPDQVGTIAPVREGGCCIRLRSDRWILLPLSPDAVARVLWAAPAKAA